MLRAYATHLGADPHRAADIAQEALLISWQNRDSFRAGADLGAWLRGIARKLLLKESERARRLVPMLDEFIEQSWAGAGADETSDGGRLAAEKDALVECRTRLTPHLSRLIALRYDEGLSCADVAHRAGMGESAVKVGLLRAREALAECVRRKLEAQS
jgi:RNA polymerase sigma-70 factor (ECF subfamily)